MNVTGARLNVPPVLFETCVALTVDEPVDTGVTVTVFTSPHEPNVIDEGLTVATDVSLDDMETTSVVLPVRLQPFLPSPFGARRKRLSSRSRRRPSAA